MATPRPDTSTPEGLERSHVADVYNLIADHFSDTRYKPWPVVDDFLRELPPGSVGADVGCGNGKYLQVNPALHMMGSDRSSKLIDICRDRGFEALVCDNLALPYRDSSFDFAISIAVIHHFSTPCRRKNAIQELIRILRPGGRVLIFVWALEQKRKYPSASGEPTPDAQKPTETAVYVRPDGEADVVYQRYYHMFVKGELDALVGQVPGAAIVQTGYDRDNWYVVAEKRE
ncbi:S-adenosyl-L-methionine-dependent methyltransferase [Blyttiomyces helicus]|uniref:S-adenosyl-L-methionine-dependent methyltransferase n=1 Tax=Blyttiomyces helicus TaxID=388810 RepID=A0A4P9VWX4_9FUNG|nr:S-adenosyl-L-methionine-dependent methyltransferase [Blyttiomyces helicus]|eukprot:RKO84204.1 S-adenosyl-L-methionine-dependent methyltransferase [Blyttiomyces helicus]